MRGNGVIATVVGAVVSAVVLAMLTGAGVFNKAEKVGGGLVSHGSPTSTLVAQEPPVAGAARVEVNEALDLLDAYSKAAGRRDYAAAYAYLSQARQDAFPRGKFDVFWNGIARTGFFPDDNPSIEKALWRDDGAAVITVTLFFDECDKKTRSVEHVTVVVERDAGVLHLGAYSSKQDSRLTGTEVPPDVLATNCPP